MSKNTTYSIAKFVHLLQNCDKQKRKKKKREATCNADTFGHALTQGYAPNESNDLIFTLPDTELREKLIVSSTLRFDVLY